MKASAGSSSQAVGQGRPTEQREQQARLHGGSSRRSGPSAFTRNAGQAQSGQTPGHRVQGGEDPRPAALALQDFAALAVPAGVGDLATVQPAGLGGDRLTSTARTTPASISTCNLGTCMNRFHYFEGWNLQKDRS
jgi:hypothetical protein